jgi:predicted DCC family thiol-disulfide oxidoreductase YuxK
VRALGWPTSNGWTGGQYSAFRIVLGVCLLTFFIREALGQTSARAFGAFSVGIAALLVLCVFLAVGFRDRLAAGALAALPLLVGDPQLWPLSSPVLITLVLLVHALGVPGAPFGSWDARGRLDPGGGWRFPPKVFALAWVLASLVYTAVGITRLQRLEPSLTLIYLPLALVTLVRPWLWLAMAVLHVGRVALLGASDPVIGLLALHALTFDPGWIPGRDAGTAPALVFYDGACGFCHAWVRVLHAEDADGRAFLFAPLDSERARAAISDEQRRALGDTVIVVTPKGRVLSRSDAAVYIATRLGGLWRIAGALLSLVPRAARDAAYDAVAAVRHRLFARPKEACPLLPPHLRQRFAA